MLTLTPTFGAVAVFPAASRARAEIVCGPFETLGVQVYEKLGPVPSTSLPTGASSTRNCTPANVPLSEAVAVSVVGPVMFAAGPGAVTLTVGTTASRVTVSVAVATLVAASVAVTVIMFDPGCRAIP